MYEHGLFVEATHWHTLIYRLLTKRVYIVCTVGFINVMFQEFVQTQSTKINVFNKIDRMLSQRIILSPRQVYSTPSHRRTEYTRECIQWVFDICRGCTANLIPKS